MGAAPAALKAPPCGAGADSAVYFSPLSTTGGGGSWEVQGPRKHLLVPLLAVFMPSEQWPLTPVAVAGSSQCLLVFPESASWHPTEVPALVGQGPVLSHPSASSAGPLLPAPEFP